ncbi:hypothetical protein FYK55_17000 [Roseiconus nitratireducens]|uniref:Uncharacterized protein n=1 Tax=Roseiconus nitratireducens TaxID=2605748 RepID=A0A5M6D327_9BACT|nr:hypothetical protein [Roseiconus nitratireducens]KAA5541894.1 hypothetical protein FYK55_17000 [Roseiconus nitratireducens]
MTTQVFRYEFAGDIDFAEVESSLVLSIMAVESLHGASEVRLDAAHAIDEDKRNCVIDASTEVGRDINRLFVGFLRREFGEDAFQVERLSEPPTRKAS